jgi:hypothetical protein
MDELKQRLHAVQVNILLDIKSTNNFHLNILFLQEDLTCMRTVVSSFSTIPQDLTHSMV